MSAVAKKVPKTGAERKKLHRERKRQELGEPRYLEGKRESEKLQKERRKNRTAQLPQKEQEAKKEEKRARDRIRQQRRRASKKEQEAKEQERRVYQGQPVAHKRDLAKKPTKQVRFQEPLIGSIVGGDQIPTAEEVAFADESLAAIEAEEEALARQHKDKMERRQKNHSLVDAALKRRTDVRLKELAYLSKGDETEQELLKMLKERIEEDDKLEETYDLLSQRLSQRKTPHKAVLSSSRKSASSHR